MVYDALHAQLVLKIQLTSEQRHFQTINKYKVLWWWWCSSLYSEFQPGLASTKAYSDRQGNARSLSLSHYIRTVFQVGSVAMLMRVVIQWEDIC